MPAGAKRPKYVPQSGGTKVNFPPVGQGPPGVNSTGTRATGTSNSSGMSGSKSGSKSGHNPY